MRNPGPRPKLQPKPRIGTKPVRDPFPPGHNDSARRGFAPAPPNKMAPKAPVPKNAYSLEIKSDSQFDEMATLGDGLIRGTKSLKVLIDKQQQENPKVYFIDGNYPSSAVKYHYDFAVQVLGANLSSDEFNDVTYWGPTLEKRKYIAATIQTFKTAQGEFYGLQFFPQDIINENMILYAFQAVKAKFAIPNRGFHFVAMGIQQSVETIRDAMKSLGADCLTIEDILGNTKYIPMNTGKAYGYLRVFPENPDKLTRYDIPIFRELPLDLSVVAATGTYDVQNPGSHINLKSKERGTPNIVIHDLEK